MNLRVPHSQFFHAVPTLLTQHYKAAGVCLSLRSGNGNDVFTLLGRTIRRRQEVVWGEFGGKREHFDAGPAETAFRELEEEYPLPLRSLVTLSDVANSPAVWNLDGFYVLYMVNMVQRKAEMDQHDDLCWVANANLEAHLRQRSPLIGYRLPGGSCIGPIHLWHFFARTLRMAV